MKRYVQGLLNWMKEHAPAVLPAAVAGAVAALIAYYAMEVGGYWSHQPLVGNSIPGWLFGAFFTIIAAVCFAFLSYQKARQYPIAANAAAVVGVITILATTCATRWCDSVGGVTAGLTAAGIVAALAAVVNSQSRKVRQNTVTDRDDNIDQSETKPDEPYIGIVPFVQVTLALIMALIVYSAITNDDLSTSRTKLLTFAGIGITAAASISPKLSLRTILAMAGAVISITGAYIEADQALTESGSRVSISTIVIAASIATGGLVIGPAFHSHIAVRIVIAPLLAGAAATAIASMAALIPAIFISAGCDVPEPWGAVSILVIIVVGFIVGFGTLVVTAAIAIRSWWTRRATRAQHGNE